MTEARDVAFTAVEDVAEGGRECGANRDRNRPILDHLVLFLVYLLVAAVLLVVVGPWALLAAAVLGALWLVCQRFLWLLQRRKRS